MSVGIESTEPIFSVVYVSSASRLLSNEDLKDILTRSRRNNEREHITGMLLYKDGNFMQVLEGSETAVRGRLDVIAKDPRHRGIIRLMERRLPERDFEKWYMGFHQLRELTGEALQCSLSGSFLDRGFQEKPAASYKLLRSFARNM